MGYLNKINMFRCKNGICAKSQVNYIAVMHYLWYGIPGLMALPQ